MSFNLSLMHTSGLLRHLDNLHSFGQDQLAIDALDHLESSLTLICEKLVKAAEAAVATVGNPILRNSQRVQCYSSQFGINR